MKTLSKGDHNKIDGIRSEKSRESKQKRTDTKVASKGHRRINKKHKKKTSAAQTNNIIRNKQKETT